VEFGHTGTNGDSVAFSECRELCFETDGLIERNKKKKSNEEEKKKKTLWFCG
jgi:hypothetical protein